MGSSANLKMMHCRHELRRDGPRQQHKAVARRLRSFTKPTIAAVFTGEMDGYYSGSPMPSQGDGLLLLCFAHAQHREGRWLLLGFAHAQHKGDDRLLLYFARRRGRRRLLRRQHQQLLLLQRGHHLGLKL